jgi:hypothetical protein
MRSPTGPRPGDYSSFFLISLSLRWVSVVKKGQVIPPVEKRRKKWPVFVKKKDNAYA